MKIRTGFVSNSSSSSFVMIGWDNLNISDEFAEEIDERGESDLIYEYEMNLFGVELFNDSDYNTESIPLYVLENAMTKAFKLKEEFNIEGEPRLICGTMGC